MNDTIATQPSTRRGVYPGSFNPPTIAHVAIAEAALAQCQLTSITFAISRRALAKEATDDADRPRMTDRIEVLRTMVAADRRFELLVTEKQLIVDIADGFDVVVMGADKWQQIQDPTFYGDDLAARDQAMAALPELALFPRRPFSTNGAPTLRLDANVLDLIDAVSSSRARAGDDHLMVDAARVFDRKTGAWTDPDRYETYLRS